MSEAEIDALISEFGDGREHLMSDIVSRIKNADNIKAFFKRAELLGAKIERTVCFVPFPPEPEKCPDQKDQG
jgi:hypothetical protein